MGPGTERCKLSGGCLNAACRFGGRGGAPAHPSGRVAEMWNGWHHQQGGPPTKTVLDVAPGGVYEAWQAVCSWPIPENSQ